MGDATTINLEAWDRDFRINVTSMVMMCRFAIPEMRKQGRGSIINMSSVSGCKCKLQRRDATSIMTNCVCSSAWRQPQPVVSHHQRRHHPNDTCHGSTSWQREHPRELCSAGNGVHSHDSRARND